MCLLAVTTGQLTHQGHLRSVQLAVQNAFSPARFVVTSISSPQNPPEMPTLGQKELAELQDQLLANELQRRQLLIENARLKQKLLQTSRLPNNVADLEQSLLTFDTVPATILTNRGTPETLKTAFIDAGKSSGLRESQLVISGPKPLLDRGLDANLEPGQPVVSGSVIVGRIQKTAAWVSSLQFITDEDFSAAVEIVRPSEFTTEFPTTGILRGSGDRHCRIDSVPYTASVSVGDDVFSADLNGLNGPRLYFGKVTKAEFSAGGEWTIEVSPAIQGHQLHTVSVVRSQLNQARIRPSEGQASQSPSVPRISQQGARH